MSVCLEQSGGVIDRCRQSGLPWQSLPANNNDKSLWRCYGRRTLTSPRFPGRLPSKPLVRFFLSGDVEEKARFLVLQKTVRVSCSVCGGNAACGNYFYQISDWSAAILILRGFGSEVSGQRSVRTREFYLYPLYRVWDDEDHNGKVAEEFEALFTVASPTVRTVDTNSYLTRYYESL